MFVYSEENGAYTARLNGVEFVCQEPSAELEDLARVLADCYEDRLPDLAEYMAGELNGVFGPLDGEELAQALGRPQIDLDQGVVSYLEQSLDDHVLSVEFEGALEEFLDFSMDG